MSLPPGLELPSYTPSSHSVQILSNFINGSFVVPQSGVFLDNISPATGVVISKIPNSNADDVNSAVSAANTALPAWKTLSFKDRAMVLGKIADYIENIEKSTQFFSQLESYDCGKPRTLAATVDIPRTIDNFRYFASLGQHESGSVSMIGNDPYSPQTTAAVHYSQRSAIGVVGLIVPWNLPLYLLTWKLAPALLCGNTVVIKPSELTPLTANALMVVIKNVFEELSPFFKANNIDPNGIVNLTHGLGATAGDALVNHPTVRMISFTGGSFTGSIVGANCGRTFKRVSLELGGKNTATVFEDVDIAQVVPIVARSAFTNQGQICLCNSRILVHDSIYDEFVAKLLEHVKDTFVPGDPTNPQTRISSLISEQHMQKVLSYVEIAKNEGGVILSGGERFTGFTGDAEKFNSGFFVLPTLITNVKPTDRIAQEEVFGPVVCILRFSDEKEALSVHNNTVYGLAGSVFTKDLSRGHRFAQGVETGMIWVNTWMIRTLDTPFGGVKTSGNMHEGGTHSLDCFSYTKNITIKL